MEVGNVDQDWDLDKRDHYKSEQPTKAARNDSTTIISPEVSPRATELMARLERVQHNIAKTYHLTHRITHQFLSPHNLTLFCYIDVMSSQMNSILQPGTPTDIDNLPSGSLSRVNRETSPPANSPSGESISPTPLLASRERRGAIAPSPDVSPLAARGHKRSATEASVESYMAAGLQDRGERGDGQYEDVQEDEAMEYTW